MSQRYQNRSIKKGKKSQRKNNNNTDGLAPTTNYTVVLPAKQWIMPDRLFTKLCFQGLGTSTITSPAVHNSFRYIPSAAYDVDPGLGSAAMPGFADLASIYRSYRVTVSKITVTCNSFSSANAVEMSLIPVSLDPGSAPSFNEVASWPGNPFSKVKLLSQLGGPPVTLSSTMTTERMFGSKEVYFDDKHAAFTNSSPVNNWYWAVGIIADGAPLSPLKCSFRVSVEIGLEFYSRVVQQI
jgi:hypothetical protein